MLIDKHIFEFLLISKVDGLVSMHCETPLCDVSTGLKVNLRQYIKSDFDLF